MPSHVEETPVVEEQALKIGNLYPSIDNAAMMETADSTLVRFGGKFEPSLITGARGIYIYTAEGRKILDFTSGQMSCLIGHGHPEIVETITQHAAHLDHLFSGMLSPPVVQLAEKLTSLLPHGLDRAMFLSTGGESNEAAIKMAKIYTGKFEIVGLGASWHGMTGAASATTYHSGRTGYGPMVPGNLVLPSPNAYRSYFRHPDGSYDWETELNYGWNLIDTQSVGSLAAVIIEPILSSGGMHVLPKGYLKAMKAHCEKREMLLIVDEAQTGVGRCGSMFAIEHEEVTPDILTLSKTLGNGLPLAAVITSNKIEQTCYERGYLFYTTHVNDPLPAAVGLKVLEVVIRENLVERSWVAGLRLNAGLKDLQSKYGCIGDVRGRGLMAGVEIITNLETKEQGIELAAALGDRMMELGLSANLLGTKSFGGIFRIAPPITITDEELEAGLAIFEEAFKSTPGTMAR
ncbi:related to CAR2-ornithine aminotransferase [Rhynchosporium graminicola]|uniref:Related to CAR2-ornithine aminotransferase n=1 Tax=Rhynchosporium graminicola TaxID=2792576 RepID=A0A1E1KMT7_9HELO|nr:related to CAR2-ornithine aminotransferase [Rhynchosporium commune]